MTDAPDLVSTLTAYGLSLLKEAETSAADEAPSMTERIKLLDAMTRLAALEMKERKNAPSGAGINQYRSLFTGARPPDDAAGGTSGAGGGNGAKPPARAARGRRAPAGAGTA